jgi:predicted dithiol-disulfide oxidoreductase (DUF899 family)
MPTHPIASHADWLAARTALWEKEKAFTHLKDDLARQRRELPWEAVETSYVFDGPNGRQTLEELFDGRSQLIIYHFMFPPEATAGCPHCSHVADTFNGVVVHMMQRDVTFVAVSRAPYDKLAAYEKRMGWTFKWVSSGGTTFNFDYHVSFTPQEVRSKKAFFNYTVQDPGTTDREAVSVFVRADDGRVYHTYSAYGRGIEILMADYQYLDLTPRGRDEGGRGPFWVKRHDEYPGAGRSD